MGLSKATAARLDAYQDRLKKGKAKKIKPDDINKVMRKLRERQGELEQTLAETKKPAKRARITKKLAVIGDLIERAEWLKGKLKSL